jgi:hypothetical protein
LADLVIVRKFTDDGYVDMKRLDYLCHEKMTVLKNKALAESISNAQYKGLQVHKGFKCKKPFSRGELIYHADRILKVSPIYLNFWPNPDLQCYGCPLEWGYGDARLEREVIRALLPEYEQFPQYNAADAGGERRPLVQFDIDWVEDVYGVDMSAYPSQESLGLRPYKHGNSGDQ